ncbi:lysM and putative peptidoglycan-binding domain-containing protein 1 [Corythoichthys intestinalis]|uniref:lysM and putative peptidoglycan-binding domain-containing protein 1 n=1 Tax=Corythoichthys intestinalis TaxID=161448 RepID=UPI0025A5A4C9|nr:lysM and putative peptidoglycan-binding domain-containing protein 1 [Corythoichthys intestinalis]XP_057690330.1 lysM and putative peptidoglycan-binding domain-containing protein 1 [Corythoichthys intestinalis]XP_057690331.1 lysM and putative peptidoglycan-binding domain-containing protein 1 [Corythoichthys intestinalis]XP_061788922.1 lysM and putative peptidoglycan-binding domain-containing protein 1-like [Nerophis lumbriciformis]
MSAGKVPADAAGGSGLLRGGRGSRSYGSLVRSNLSPVRRRHIEHRTQPGETLQGLALKYGVTMEQIKRVNRLYTNDSIFLKKFLSIPLPSHLDTHTGATDADVEDDDEEEKGPRLGGVEVNKSQAVIPTCVGKDVTAGDFLSRLDGFISESKRAAARRWQDAEKRLADLEAVCSTRTEDRPRPPPGRRRRSAAGGEPPNAAAVPLTTTKLTMRLKEREDDIFEL